ncbi:ACT domain-containing protein, partial [Vibrio sp.]|uniref:ACT domain-containing protein n=1 Tax=Vibrio sp. TaxID=678 RepID=UPI00312020E2
ALKRWLCTGGFMRGSLSAELKPLASFIEAEGLTLVLEKAIAEKSGIDFEGVYRQITLTVHSSLEAVGLTAAVSTKLASKGISANVIAAYYHDHIFVPASKANAALAALMEFSQN